MKTLFKLSERIKSVNDFYVFDTETGTRKKQGKNTVINWELEARPEKFIFGVVYGYNFTKVIHSHKEMVKEFQDSRYKNKIVYAHNFGRYDGSVLFDNVFSIDPEAIYIGSRFISCTNGNCTFADSLNIYKASVKEIGAKMGLKKLGMNEGEYKTSIWPKDKTDDINGCIRDCQIIWDALHEIFNECSDIKLTIGSLAMAYYRRFAQPFHLNSDEFLTKYFFNSYYGGRTEAFKLGNTHSKVIDVNSLYPYEMKVTVFPNPESLQHTYNNDPKTFERVLKRFEGCVFCEVFHPEFFIGLLPYRKDGKLIFPNGTFEGWFNFNELRFAISQGVKVTKIYELVFGEKMPSPFETFVDKLYLEKFIANSQGRKLDEWKYKYLLNNLYGKFGQRIDEKTIYIDDVVNQYELIRSHQYAGTFIKLLAFNTERQDAFLVVKETKKIEISYSIPSFASYITSAGRVTLAKKLIEMKANKPVYCDTDSIFFEIDDNVESSNVLGEWKVENKIVTQINGLKNYRYIDENKVERNRIKGVPGRAIEVAKNRYEFETLIGTKEGLRRNMDIGVKAKRTKIISGKYDKRVVLKDGETKPIFI